MKHKIIPATWKTKEALLDVIRSHERDKWSVAALGTIFGSDVLVLVNDGSSYAHEMISIFWKTKNKLKEILVEKEISGWRVCAIGECFGSSIMILKKPEG